MLSVLFSVFWVNTVGLAFWLDSWLLYEPVFRTPCSLTVCYKSLDWKHLSVFLSGVTKAFSFNSCKKATECSCLVTDINELWAPGWTSDSSIQCFHSRPTHPIAMIKLKKAFHGLCLLSSFAWRMLVLPTVIYCNSFPEIVAVRWRKKNQEFIAYCQLPPGKKTTLLRCDLLINCLILCNSGLAF